MNLSRKQQAAVERVDISTSVPNSSQLTVVGAYLCQQLSPSLFKHHAFPFISLSHCYRVVTPADYGASQEKLPFVTNFPDPLQYSPAARALVVECIVPNSSHNLGALHYVILDVVDHKREKEPPCTRTEFRRGTWRICSCTCGIVKRVGLIQHPALLPLIRVWSGAPTTGASIEYSIEKISSIKFA